MRILTTLVQHANQIEIGAWYLIRGNAGDGMPMPPQVFFVRRKDLNTIGGGIPYMVGDLFVNIEGKPQVLPFHMMPLVDVNVPEHGIHGIHMERLNESTLRQAFRHDYDQFRDAQQERRKARRPVALFHKVLKPYIG